MYTDSIANRAVGGFPLSIATSLAIESACGVHPEIVVNKPPILDYQELWVNLRTLFRNFLGSVERTAVQGLRPPEIAAVLSEEMDIITSIIADHSKGRCPVVFYVSNYKDIDRKYRVGVVRMDNTDKQKEYTAIQTQTIGLLLKQRSPGEIKGYDLKLKPEFQTKALILTHMAYDLLSSKAFAELVLLESHTGAIKHRAQWYTKYLNGKELSMFPFREDFIQIFGDSETFRPGDPRLRKELIEIATKYKWTAVTTRDKLVYGIDQMQNPFYKETLKSILV